VAGRRVLGPAQLAFVRAWAEGIDPAIAWNRFLYVDGAGDIRRARGELQRLLEDLRRLARLHQRPDIAALLLRDPEAMVERDAAPAPTLDAFRAQFDEDFFTERELLAEYHSRYGTPDARSAARRRQRLRERLVLAIQWLQERVARPPRPDDAVSLWLDPRLAKRLSAVGIQTLHELLFWVGHRGFHWYRPVPRLGPEGAARVVRWLREHEALLGRLPSPALVPLSQLDTTALQPAARTGIVPLERFAPPADERSGAQGLNRAPLAHCKLQAANDFESVQAWLRLRIAGSHTWRAYRKEAERFLLWAVVGRRKALSSLDGDDCVAYRDFLSAPGPEWVGPRNAQRWSEAWRPFEGPLSARSQASARVIVRSLCEWLVRRRYLDSNPWDDVPQRPDAPAMPSTRALSSRQWRWVEQWLQAQPPSPARQRLAFLMRFGYLTGLRTAELSAARLGWFRHEALDDGEMAWSMLVLGKRNKWREVPLPEVAVQALGDYLVQRGLPRNPLACEPNAPLLAPLLARPGQATPLSCSRIYDILCDGFERCAVDVYPQDPRAAEQIRQASTHWLRHTHGTHAVARGVPLDVLQANLGHESPATTAIYVKAEKGRRHRAVLAAFDGASHRPDVGS
jgi:site-specific recombinase XerD